MRKQIRAEIIKMVIVVVMLLGITALAFDFVKTGIMAKALLNGSIIAVFIFGIYLCFRNTLALKNEEVAFSALVEAHEDIKRAKLKGSEDPYWRHYRCLEPGTVFGRPHLLGHFFEMVYDEMFRSKKLKVSVETMAGLVHGVESRLREERSAIAFMTGLLVFMGLIGAFIGLIQMVQSVGELVGSLANAGGGAGGMSKLITDLQGPLKGMSVGFSSSLFGLFGSMTLGLMNQFSGHAGTILKTEFEAWLASAAQIDEEAEHQDDAKEMPAIEALTAAAAGFGKVQTSFDAVAKLVGDVARLQQAQGEALARTTKAIEDMGRRHEELAQLVAASGAVAPALVGAQQEMIAASRGVELRLVDGFDKLERGLSTVQRGHAEAFRELGETTARASAVTIAAIEMGANRQIEAIDKLAAARPPAGDPAVAARLEAGMAQGFGEVARAIETSFLAYARLIETTGAKASAQPRGMEPAPEAKPVPVAVGADYVPAPASEIPQVDAAEMLRRLQSAVAKQYRQP